VIFHDPAMRKCVQGMFWRFITDLGDTTVMAPTAIAIAIWLFWRRGSRESLIWLFSIGAGGVLAVLTKIAFLGWGIGVPALDFTAISGHSMMATAVLTVCGYFFGAAFSRTHAIVGFAIGFGLGLLVAFSRVQIGAHSSSEAIAGAAVGLLIALGSTRVNRARTRAALAPIVVMLAMFAFVASGHARRAPTQAWMIKLALALSGHPDPFTRWDGRPASSD
jgi:membrane-associated phospholipid phosphatase